MTAGTAREPMQVAELLQDAKTQEHVAGDLAAELLALPVAAVPATEQEGCIVQQLHDQHCSLQYAVMAAAVKRTDVLQTLARLPCPSKIFAAHALHASAGCLQADTFNANTNRALLVAACGHLRVAPANGLHSLAFSGDVADVLLEALPKQLPCLTTLKVWAPDPPTCTLLAAALPGMPALRQLSIWTGRHEQYEDADAVLAALTCVTALSKLDLHSCKMDASAWHALAASIPSITCLRELSFEYTERNASEEARAAIAACAVAAAGLPVQRLACHGALVGVAPLLSALGPSLRVLVLHEDLYWSEISEAGLVSCAAQFSALSALTDLHVGMVSEAREHGWPAVAEGIGRLRSLRTLEVDFQHCSGGGGGSAAVLQALPALPALQDLWISCRYDHADDDDLDGCQPTIARLASLWHVWSVPSTSFGDVGAAVVVHALQAPIALKVFNFPRRRAASEEGPKGAAEDCRHAGASRTVILRCRLAWDRGRQALASTMRKHPQVKRVGVSWGSAGAAGFKEFVEVFASKRGHGEFEVFDEGIEAVHIFS